jgi:tetratricopeptide (TPR) repeat protein
MKTQRRHELQTNELADRIGRYLVVIRPYQNAILFGLVAVVVAGCAVFYLYNQRTAQAQLSWSDYFNAFADQKAESLEDVARLHSGSTAALWARQSAGDVNLAQGASQLYSDRKQAEKSLKDAEKQYLAVEQEAAKYPMLLERARYGLAQVYESMCDVEKAKTYYEKVAKTNPESPVGRTAKERSDRLSDESVERFYAWFERQEPVRPRAEESAVGAGPEVPDDLGELPERPDLSFPFSDVSGDEPEPPAGDEMPSDDSDAAAADVTPEEEQPSKEPPADPAADQQAGESKPNDPAAEPSPEPPKETPEGGEEAKPGEAAEPSATPPASEEPGDAAASGDDGPATEPEPGESSS